MQVLEHISADFFSFASEKCVFVKGHPHLARIGQTFGVCALVQNMPQRRRAIRENNRPHEERGQRGGNLPTPQAPHRKRKDTARVR